MASKKKEDKKLTKDQALKKLETLKRDLLNIRFKRSNHHYYATWVKQNNLLG